MSEKQIVEVVRGNRVDNNKLKKMNEQVQTNSEVELRKSLRKRSAKNQTGENQIKKRKVEVKPKTIEKDSKESAMSFIDLNDDVLMEILRRLNWFDAINLTRTCKRMRNLNYSWADKRRQEFNLDNYLTLPKNSFKKCFPRIGPYIRKLKTSECNMNETLTKNCKNVNSLIITDNVRWSNASRINTWIKKLNLESLRFHNCDRIDKLLTGVSGLKELEINVLNRNSSKFIEKNGNLERLSIEVNNNFNYDVLQKLEHLKCLHIRTADLTNFGEIQKLENLGGLTEFAVQCSSFSEEPEIMQSFLKHLAQNTKLNKLELVDCSINNGMFDALKLFNFNALNLCCDYNEDEFTKFIEEYSPTLLKHLKLGDCCTSEQLYLLIKKWSSVETICIFTGIEVDYEHILDNEFIKKISKISKNRPPLRLHIRNGLYSGLPSHIEVHVNFRSQQFNVVVQDEEFCCSTSTVFGFPNDECFHY